MKNLDEKHRKVILMLLIGGLILVCILFGVNFSRFHPIAIYEFGSNAVEIWLNLVFTFSGGILLFFIGVFMSEKQRILKKLCTIHGIIIIFTGVIMGIITVVQLLF